MNGLRALFESFGLLEVETYVQSGNVAFASPAGKPAPSATALEDKIAKTFGVKTKVLIRTGRQLTSLEHPFVVRESELSRLHVLFLRDLPTRAAVGRLDKDRSPPDRFTVKAREVFLHYPHGAGRSKLAIDYFEKVLGTVGTARNWKTVLRLREMVAS
jgi:uncharacterized protein (DUF1697 family)